MVQHLTSEACCATAALSSVLVVACSQDGVLEARNLADPSNSVILKTGHAAPVLTMTVFPRGDGARGNTVAVRLWVLAARRALVPLLLYGRQVSSPLICRRYADVSVLTTDEEGIALVHVLAARRDESTPKATGRRH